MDTFTFKAIGTEWCISLDGGKISTEFSNEIYSRVQKFEKQFSRFIIDSEVNSFRNAKQGTYPISEEFYKLLLRADILKVLTDGRYDPTVAGLLERAGYDKDYSFKVKNDVDSFSIPEWSLERGLLKLSGPTTFDIGGIGKGYCIDLVADILKENNYDYFMVEAGGDMFGTTKSNGDSWNIAIQLPGKYDEAAGTTKLNSEAIAVSDTFRRRWGNWNHIVNPHLKKPIEDIVGVSAVAETAFDADSMTSALFLGDNNSYSEAAKKFNSSYLIFYKNNSCLRSNNWKGELFG